MNKRIVLVSGGSSGIGKAIAELLVEKSYLVVNADKEAGKSKGVDFFECDLTLTKDIDALYAYVKEKYGIPDVLVSNAGQGIHEKLTEGDPEKWKSIIDVNIMGSLRLIRAFTPEMVEKDVADVFFISSISGRQYYEYGGVYSASKAAINNIANTLRRENNQGLRVSTILPGVVDTSFFENMISSDHSVEDIGYGSVSAEEVARLLLYMLQLPKSICIPEVTIIPKIQPI